ncbi:ketopantoate reductase family protein [Litorisediminicola beolgyonensis]|uniref:2-dehydropantoate 2-reductase n=1 Tax=Litorisediminicola beolgyonensis TaxID=1173614 RepID=A0ABW3ZLB1_9RHOB
MRIATVATGGIGGYLAVKLARAGHEVACLARGAHLAAIREHGLRLEAPEDGGTVCPALATDRPAEIGEVDAVILGVKAGGLDAAAEACRPLLKADTLVVPFLNGVEASDRLAALLPERNVGNGAAYVSTTISAPGVITQTGLFSRFVFGERGNQPSDRVAGLRAAFTEAGLDAPESADIEAELWTKFALFSAVSGVTAAGRCTIADIFAHADLAELFETIVTETDRLARARDVAVPDTLVSETMERARGLPPMMRASTAIDLEHGRALETPWINGAVARLSDELGLDAPANRAVAALLAPHVHGRC